MTSESHPNPEDIRIQPPDPGILNPTEEHDINYLQADAGRDARDEGEIDTKGLWLLSALHFSS